MSLNCRVSAIYAFCWPTTQLPSIANCVVAVIHSKPVIANCVPKFVAMATSLSTSGPHLKHDSLGPSKPITQTASRSVQLFCTDDCRVSLYLSLIHISEPTTQTASRSVQLFCTAHHRVTLTMGRPSPLKIAPSHEGIRTPSNAWFPGPTQVFNPNGSSIGAWLTCKCDRQIDRPSSQATWSVTTGRIYVRSIAMRPKK